MNEQKKRRKMKSAILDNTTPCRRLLNVCLFCSYMYGYVCDALSKGHSMCVRARRNHHIIHPIPVATSTRLFLLFLCAVLSHYRCRFSTKRMHFFSPSTHTYIHTWDAYKQALWAEQKSFFFFLLLLSHTYWRWRKNSC